MEPCHSLKSFEMKFILTKRGARSVMHDGFKYMLNRRGCEGQCYWIICALDEQLLVRVTSCYPLNSTIMK